MENKVRIDPCAFVKVGWMEGGRKNLEGQKGGAVTSPRATAMGHAKHP